MLLALACLATQAAPAQTPEAPPSTSDDLEMAKLMAILNEETAVATQTRLNADFVPGIVSVLSGDELEAMGIETAWEALSLVAGVQAVRDPGGQPSMIVRGLDFPFNSGNVKVLMDGVPLSRESAGINGIALQLPIQAIARMEVIRGPGSVIYGDFAFMGLVNLVTRTDRNRFFLRQGGDRATSAGAHLSFGDRPDGWKVSLSGAGLTGRHAPLPAPREAKDTRGWGALLASRGGFSLKAEAITRELDDPVTQGSASSEQTHWIVEGRYGRDLVPSLRAEVHASFQHDRLDTQRSDFRGGIAKTGLDVTWDGWRHHSFLLAASYADGTIDEATSQPPAQPPPQPPPPVLVLRGVPRRVLGLVLQDRVDLSDRIAVTAGVRYDRYSDLRDRLTPRLAAVLRASDRFIVKLQYAEGFRAPTFFEEYTAGTSTPRPDFEVNRTTELNAVYRLPRTVVRGTLFTSRIDDMIYAAGPTRFDNSRSGRARGFELEWEQQLTPSLKLQSNVSFTDAQDDRNDGSVLTTPGVVAEWLGNLSVLFRATPRLLLAGRATYVGDRSTPTDARGYTVVDVAVTRNDLLVPGLQLRAGVKNAFDDEPRYYFGGRPGLAGSYLTYPGRTLFAQIAFSR